MIDRDGNKRRTAMTRTKKTNAARIAEVAARMARPETAAPAATMVLTIDSWARLGEALKSGHLTMEQFQSLVAADRAAHAALKAANA
jgi:hypothetical protein